MSKDPAFLFYSKDWLQGTSQMMPEEKGVYIDLLAHQHQDGDLPTDIKRLSRIVGLSEAEFLPLWSTIKIKFQLTSDNRLVNRKLMNITSERSTKSIRNTITGTFASMIRLSGHNDNIKDELKKSFRIDDFLSIPKENLTERLTDWLSLRLKSIANANGNAIGNGNKEGGTGEGTFFGKPGEDAMNLELPDLKLNAATEIYFFTNTKILKRDQVLDLWSIFKKQNFTGQKFYASEQDVFGHFINWIKTQKINGNNSGGYGETPHTTIKPRGSFGKL